MKVLGYVDCGSGLTAIYERCEEVSYLLCVCSVGVGTSDDGVTVKKKGQLRNFSPETM